MKDSGTDSYEEYSRDLGVFPSLEDEKVWARLMGCETLPTEIAMVIEGGKYSRLFARLSTMLRGKFLDRKVLTSEAGFVGIGVS